MRDSEHIDYLTCIVCPNSCRLTVHYDEETKELLSVTGHLCNRGKVWAEQELFHPMRTVCSSVAVSGGTEPLASIRTTDAIPRDKIPELMELLKSITLPAPVRIDQIVVHKPLGTDCNVIITRNVDRR